VPIVFLLLIAAGAGSASALTVDDLCPATENPCTFGRNLREEGANATLDLGGRALELEPGARLDVGTGSMTIIASSLKLRTNTRLLARGGRVIVTTTGGIEIGGQSRIDVSDTTSPNDFPGTIQLQAGSDVVIEGLLDAGATTKTDGGFVEVRGNAVTVGANGGIDVTGGGLSAGGVIGITALGAVGIAGTIDAPGGDSGGSVEIDAGSVATSGRIDVSGGPAGAGALVDILARGSVVIGGVISGEVDPPGIVIGQAAEVSIVTTGSVELNEAIILTGGAPSGEGGTLEVEADGDITQRGAITLAGRGAGGVGGEARFAANGNLTLADIDVAAVTAGTIVTQSVGGTRIGGTLNADAEFAGTAGTVDVGACTLDMDSAAVLSSAGLGGTNLVRSGGQMVLRGNLLAGEANVIEYQNAAVPPVVSGTVAPSAVPQVNAGLDLCTVPGGGSTTTTLPGNCGTLADFDGLLCRLAALTATLGQSSDAPLGGKKTAKKLKKKAARATSLVEAARDATKAKKRGKKLKGAGKQVASLLKIVGKGLDKGKIDAALAGTLRGLGEAAAVQFGQPRNTPL
jgi:hypothetical protein